MEEGKDFTWSQEFENCQVSFPLPEGTRARDLDVEIKERYLTVKLKSGATIVDKELSHKVIAEDSYWQVEDQKELVVLLEKKANDFWKNVFVGEVEIDVSDRQPVMRSNQLSGEARMTVDKLYQKMKK